MKLKLTSVGVFATLMCAALCLLPPAAAAQSCEESLKNLLWVETPMGSRRLDKETDLVSLVSLFSFHLRGVSLEKQPQLLKLVNDRYKEFFEAQQSSEMHDSKSVIGTTAVFKSKPYELDLARLKVLVERLPRRMQNDPRIAQFMRNVGQNTWHQDPTSIATFLWLTHSAQLARMGTVFEAREAMKNAGILMAPQKPATENSTDVLRYNGYGTPPAIAAARLGNHRRQQQAEAAYWNRVEQNFEADYSHADPVTRTMMDLLPAFYLRDN